MSNAILESQATVDDQLDENSTSQLFVTFFVGQEAFAVDMSPVQEIIRIPDSVRVPLAPASLEGLSNLRGKVLPIISLRKIFGLDEKVADDTSRALVIDIGQPLGFLVDKVASVINVDKNNIEEVDGISSTIDCDLLNGVIKNVNGQSLIMLLNFDQIIKREFAEMSTLVNATATASNADVDVTSSENEDSDELQLVSFSVAGEEYAIDIINVQEIVQVPELITRVPNSATHVLGLMNLRERLLPVVSLRGLFNLPHKDIDERCRVVVISLGNNSIGIVTDSVSEVLRVPKDTVDQMPEFFTKNSELNDISQICKLDKGKRLVSIISAENMFHHQFVKTALESVNHMNVDEVEEFSDSDADDDEQIVVFRLAEGEFGVSIESVQEIVRVPDELTHVPKAPEFVEGLINLRGTVMPVIDQRKRLNLPSCERNDRQRIMVFILNGVRTGFIVDAVTEVLKVSKESIDVSPQLSGQQATLLNRVANLQKVGRMIQLIDTSYLIDDADAASLANIA